MRISHALIEIGLHPLQQSDPVMPLRAPVNTSFRRDGQAEATSPPCMLRLLTVISGLLLTMGTPPPGRAEPSMPLAQPQAANLARMRAESINGGLDSYRAAGCMYETGARACLVTSSDEGFTFRFRGGAPGWEQQSPPTPSLETTVRVSRDGTRVLAVPYNGPIR